MNRVLLVIYIVIILLLTYELYVAEVHRAESKHKFDGNLLPNSPARTMPPHAAEPSQQIPDMSSAEAATHAANRQLNMYRDINTDTSSFDLHEAQMLGAKAFESDVIMIDSPPIVMPPISTIIPPGATVTRISSSAAGGSTNTTSTITGGLVERPIVDPPAPSPPPPPASPIPGADSERPDHRCGPIANGAKCGPGRCCSVYGWCGSPGEPHCNIGVNAPIYNGAGLTLPQGLSNGDVVKCANGAIYRIEDNQKRLYPSLSIYEKYGKPVATSIDCKLLDTVIPGVSFI